MINIIKDLYHHDTRFRFAFIFILGILVLSTLSFFSPFDPTTSFKVPIDASPSVQHPFGTNSRGQDIFWMMTFAVRNSLLFGLMTALLSRIISIFVGLIAGYKGGMTDRVLMSINDSFVVMPVLPILILINFILKGKIP